MKSAITSGPVRALTAILAIGLPATGILADDTDTLNVTATVPVVCQIDSTTDVAFGNVNTDGSDTDASTGEIEWRCSKNTATVIELDGGGSGDINARVMDHVSIVGETLSYQLYTDSPGGTVWGDGTDGTAQPVTGTGMGAGQAQTTTVYGRVSGGSAQDAAQGDYSDAVTATIVF